MSLEPPLSLPTVKHTPWSAHVNAKIHFLLLILDNMVVVMARAGRKAADGHCRGTEAVI